MTSAEFTIRPAKPEDIPSVNTIHKHYVENTVITFVTEANTNRAALDNFDDVTKKEHLPYIVAEDNDTKKVIGYTYVSTFRGTKAGYRHSLELSLFCHPDHVRKGVGKQMLLRLIEVLKEPENWKDWFEGYRLHDFKPRQLIACMAVDIEMPGSGLKLRDWYLSLGFEQRGHLKDVGWKKGRWVDTMYLQLQLSDHDQGGT
jgi:phosphinothricin acetyltransferase